MNMISVLKRTILSTEIKQQNIILIGMTTICEQSIGEAKQPESCIYVRGENDCVDINVHISVSLPT